MPTIHLHPQIPTASSAAHLHSAEEAIALSERFFEAQTTEEEEAELIRFAFSPEALADRRLDELRAVLSFNAMAHKSSQTFQRHHQMSRKRLMRIVLTSAACLAIAIMACTVAFRPEADCVAYIGGQRTTNPSLVTQAMRQSLEQMEAPSAAPTMESQLNDMLHTLGHQPTNR